MKDCIVIGCGIIGATVALALRKQGREVTIYDEGKEKAGTIPSGGHLKPSWFGDMPKSEYEPAMELLDDIWGLKEEEFKIVLTGLKTTVYRVDTDVVVATPRISLGVQDISHLDNYPLLKFKDGTEERCRLLIVAAGVWCSELLPEIKIVGKQGVSFRYQGRIKEAFINPWAPYKQIVAHQQSQSEIWVGDGSAILASNWTEERTSQCETRCRKAMGTGVASKPSRTLLGLRPYCETGKDPCLLKRVSKRCWVATGAGKSGTIGAGWAAGRIIQATN